MLHPHVAHKDQAMQGSTRTHLVNPYYSSGNVIKLVHPDKSSAVKDVSFLGLHR